MLDPRSVALLGIGYGTDAALFGLADSTPTPTLDWSGVLEILLGQKIQDDSTGLWHVYDDSGNEISDPSGILLRANPGALLHWPKESEDVIYSTKRKKKATVSVSGSINLPLLLNQKVTKEIKSPTIRKQLIQEDEEIVLIVQSLFISNILN